MRIVEEHRQQIEEELRAGQYAPGLFLLNIGTSSGYRGIRREFLPQIDDETMLLEIAFYYRLSGRRPQCQDLLPYEWWNDNCTARVERWLVTVAENAAITEHRLVVVEHIHTNSIDVVDPTLRELIGLNGS